jgi:predicted metal-binding protein
MLPESDTEKFDFLRKLAWEFGAVDARIIPAGKVDPEVMKKLMIAETDPSVPQDVKEKAEKFWQAWKDDKRKMLQAVVDLEKAAMGKGFSLAISFVSGHCQLCEKCNTETKICVHPNLARYSEDAVGVNVRKTAQNAGITVTFPLR